MVNGDYFKVSAELVGRFGAVWDTACLNPMPEFFSATGNMVVKCMKGHHSHYPAHWFGSFLRKTDTCSIWESLTCLATKEFIRAFIVDWATMLLHILN